MSAPNPNNQLVLYNSGAQQGPVPWVGPAPSPFRNHAALRNNMGTHLNGFLRRMPIGTEPRFLVLLAARLGQAGALILTGNDSTYRAVHVLDGSWRNFVSFGCAVANVDTLRSS